MFRNLDPEVQAALIAAAGAVLVAVVGMIGLVWQGRHLKEVRNQVKNSHKTNLRDDLDDLAGAVQKVLAGQEQHTKDIADIRKDAEHEREERLALAQFLFASFSKGRD